VRAEKSGQSLPYSIASIPRRTLGGVFTYMRVLSRDFHIVFFLFFYVLIIYILDQSVDV
jgi:hypothetical protein